MGKKKHKKRNADDFYDQDTGDVLVDRKTITDYADSIDTYVDTVTDLLIIEGRSEEEVKASVKRVKKAIKDMKNGNYEKVFHDERLKSVLYSTEIEDE